MVLHSLNRKLTTLILLTIGGTHARYEHNRDAYTEAKTYFIRKWTTEACTIYGKRYR